jgi:hypothetical protein
MQSEGKTLKIDNQQLGFPSLQSSSTLDGFRQAFLSKEQCDKLELLQYSSDLGPADIYFLLRLNSIEATNNIGRKK